MIIGKKDYGIKAGRNCNTRIVIWLRIRNFSHFLFFFLHFAHYEMSWPTFSISLSVVTQHLDKEDCVTTSWDLRRSRKRKFWNCSFLESIGKVPQGKYTVMRTIFVFFFQQKSADTCEIIQRQYATYYSFVFFPLVLNWVFSK